MRIDADLLARVDLRQFVDMLAGAADNAALLRACRRALDRLRPVDAAQRAGILQAMALCEEPEALTSLDLSGGAGWEPLWSRGKRSAFHQRLTGHAAPVLALAFGTVAGRTVLASAGEDQTVRVWDAWYGDQTSVLSGHTDHIVALAFASDRAGSLASASRDGTFRVWDIGSGAATTITAPEALPVAVAFMPYQGHEMLVTATAADPGGDDWDDAWDDGSVDLWDPVTGDHLHRIHDGGEIHGICVVPVDGRTLVAGHRDGEHDSEVLLWDPVTGAREAVFTWQPPGRGEFGVEKFGPVVAVTGPDRTLIGADAWIDCSRGDERYCHTIVWWDARTHEEVRRDELRFEERLLAATTVDGGHLVATVEYHRERSGTTRGPSVSVRPAGGGWPVEMQGHHGPVRVAAFGVPQSPTLLATTGDDHAMLLWDAETKHLHSDVDGPVGGHLAVAGDSLEPVLAVGTHVGHVELIDPRTGTRTGHHRLSCGQEHRCGYGDDYKARVEHCTGSVAAGTVGGRSIVASCGAETQVVLWDPAAGSVLRELDTRTTAVGFGVVDGRTLIATSNSYGSPTTVWSPGTGDRIADLGDGAGDRYYTNEVRALDFGTVAGRTVLVTATANAVKLWDPLTGAHLASLPGPTRGRNVPGWPRWPVRGLAAGPDVVVIADDARVRVWDTARNQPLPTVDELDGPVTCLALVPVGVRCLLVVGTIGGTVSLWDSSTAVRLSTLATFARPITGVAATTLDGQPHVFAQSVSGRLTACRLSTPRR